MLPPERPGHAASAALAARRAGLAEMLAAAPAIGRGGSFGDIDCLSFAGAASKATLLHFHGGAFRIGHPAQVAAFAMALAERCAVRVIVPRYRLAPEHPFPAALHDGLAVLRALSGAGPLLLSGDSAGGALAAGLAEVARRQRIEVAGLLLLSPWLDLGATDRCFQTNEATDPLFSADAAREAAALYLQGVACDDPLASPLFADLRGFPSTFVAAGAGEVLAGDARRLHARLAQAGIPARLLLVPDMEHVAVTRDLALTGARETFDAAAAFVDEVLG